MSESPEERNKDSKKTSENNIEQNAEPTLDRSDPTEPVKAGGSKENKGAGTSAL